MKHRCLPGLASVVAALGLGLGGCTAYDRLPAPIPLTFRRHDFAPDTPKREKTLVIFLPGRGATGRDFERQRFVALLGEQTWRPVEAVTVDLNFPYYTQRTATRRLHDDVVAPLRREGYRRIWFVGCSVGALGAIFYDHEHPGEVGGIVALGPYLGEKEIARRIEAAGGLDRWEPGADVGVNGDFRRELWLAIRRGRYGQPGRVPLVLGYGTHDRFLDGQDLLAAHLPPERVFKIFGFHDWGTWRTLWKQILASSVSPLSNQSGGKTLKTTDGRFRHNPRDSATVLHHGCPRRAFRLEPFFSTLPRSLVSCGPSPPPTAELPAEPRNA